jgi:hypothetical protein
LATITTSQVVSDDVQADGSRVVRERHVDSTGREFILVNSVQAGFDAQAFLTSRASMILASEVARELSDDLAAILNDGSQAVLTFNYATVAQLRTALRDAYRSASRMQAIMIADFLSSLTNAQLQNLFGFTAAQANNFRTNQLTPAATQAAAIRAAAGA